MLFISSGMTFGDHTYVFLYSRLIGVIQSYRHLHCPSIAVSLEAVAEDCGKLLTMEARHCVQPAPTAQATALQADGWQAKGPSGLPGRGQATRTGAQGAIVGGRAGHRRQGVVCQELGSEGRVRDAVHRIPGHTDPAHAP